LAIAGRDIKHSAANLCSASARAGRYKFGCKAYLRQKNNNQHRYQRKELGSPAIANTQRWWQASYRQNRGCVFLEVCKLNLSVFFSEWTHKFYLSRVYAAFVIASFFRWTHTSFLMQTTVTNAVGDLI